MRHWSEILKRNALWKQNAEAKRFTGSEMLQLKQIIHYPYKGETSDEFWSHTKSIYMHEFLLWETWHFTIISADWQWLTFYRMDVELLVTNDSWLGKRRSKRDSTVYSTAMKPKFRNLLTRTSDILEWIGFVPECNNKNLLAVLGLAECILIVCSTVQ